MLNNDAKKKLLSLGTKKLFRCTHVSTCASAIDAAYGATWAVVVEVAAIGLECRVCYIECLTHSRGDSTREIIRIQLDRCQLAHLREFRRNNPG